MMVANRSEILRLISTLTITRGQSRLGEGGDADGGEGTGEEKGNGEGGGGD